MEAVVREAGLLSFREDIDSKEVKKKHFNEALSKIAPSVTKSTLNAYKKVEETFLKSAKAAIAVENAYLG